MPEHPIGGLIGILAEMVQHSLTLFVPPTMARQAAASLVKLRDQAAPSGRMGTKR